MNGQPGQRVIDGNALIANFFGTLMSALIFEMFVKVYSKEEADTVTEIIKQFKKHAAPQIVTQSAGMFFSLPSQFDVQFLFNGQENTKINKIGRSVIESIDVNYAPNGMWSTHNDGTPVQTTLTLNFKEMVLIDRTKIEEGY